jgi:hypothetical protein
MSSIRFSAHLDMSHHGQSHPSKDARVGGQIHTPAALSPIPFYRRHCLPKKINPTANSVYGTVPTLKTLSSNCLIFKEEIKTQLTAVQSINKPKAKYMRLYMVHVNCQQ